MAQKPLVEILALASRSGSVGAALLLLMRVLSCGYSSEVYTGRSDS